ncbi:MAG: hypothetical protein KAT43_01270 [Nanoarchaeota archaeon]|nr:hypothetical protein [Nanoarchaeota archaeon]
MEDKKSKFSENFRLFKKYYFTKKFKVKDVHLEFNKTSEKGKVVFDKNGKDLVLEGSEQDFMELCFKLKSTIRNGKNEIVDISTTPAHDTNTYYKNMEVFTSKAKTDIKELVKDLDQGKGKISPDVDLKEGVISILKKDFENKHAKEILSNYFESIALLILRLKPIHILYEKIKKNLVKNESRFNKNIQLIDQIFKQALKSDSKITPILILDKKCIVDLEFLLRTVYETIKSIDQRWQKLYPSTGGVMEGKEAMKFIAGDYEKLFEVINDPLRDFTCLLNKNNEEVVLSSEEQILNFLKRKGFSDLVSTVDNDLRNASAHNSIDFSQKGKLLLYDGKHKKRRLLKVLKYQQVLDKYEKLSDLALATIFGYIMNLEVHYLFALDSPEFKFFVVENKPKQT